MTVSMPEERNDGRKSRYRLGTKTNTKDFSGKVIKGRQQTIQKKRKYAESTDFDCILISRFCRFSLFLNGLLSTFD